MKRVFSFLLIFVLVLGISVSAFATEDTWTPADGFSAIAFPPKTFTYQGDVYPYYVVYINTTLEHVYMYYTKDPSVFYVDSKNYLNFPGNSAIFINSLSGSPWATSAMVKDLDSKLPIETIPYSNFDLRRSDGSLYRSANPIPFPSEDTSTECDGSSCPATDADHNNVCDDCGKMLVMSLRTTLFDYAILHAREGNEYYGYDYFAVFYPSNEAEWDSKFHVYLSKTPFVPVANGYVGEDIKTCVVQRTALGENGATGWSSITSVPLLELAYAEPEINFPIPPLEETVQEVTEGALMEEMITLAQVVRIILIIAVSCLALWALLEIFLKVFRTFRVK